MDQERYFDSHWRVLFCRGYRDNSNQYFYQDFKIFLSKSLSRRRDVFMAFYCNYKFNDETCNFKLRILGNGQQRDAVYLVEGQHRHPAQREEMLRALLRSETTEQIEAGITATPRDLFTQTCEANGVDVASLERIRWTLQTLEKKREKGNTRTNSVDLHIPLRREGNFAQQKPPRTGHAAKRSRSAAASHGCATKKRIHGECGTTSSNIDRQSPQEELSVAEQADEALAQPSTPHSQPDEPNPVGSDNADRSAIAQVGDVSPEETELVVVVDEEIELDRNGVDMAMDLDVTADAEVEFDRNGVHVATDLDVTADAEVEFDRNGVHVATDLEVLENAQIDVDRTEVATDLDVTEDAEVEMDRDEVVVDLEVIDVLDISSADDASEVGETELIQTVQVAEPAADNEEAVRAALRRQSDLARQLERQQQRRALHRERNLAAIQGAQMRVVAPTNIPPAVNNHQSVPVVNLDPPPIIVKNVVQLELVQLMSEADKQRTAKEDAEYAKEEQEAEAAGVVLKPRMSPFADRECCACMMRPAIVTVVGCGHFCLCGPCAINVQAKKYATCPKCRTGQHSKDGELFLQRLY